MFWPQNPKDTSTRCWRWLSISLAEVASSCAERREELEHQSSGGVSVLGGVEKLGGGGGGCGTASGSIQLLITHLTGNRWEIFSVSLQPIWPRNPCICAHLDVTHFEAQVVHVFVSGAVDGTFCGELQRVKEIVILDAEGATKLKLSVTDPTGPIVHQLENKNKKLCIGSVKRPQDWSIHILVLELAVGLELIFPRLKVSHLTYFLNLHISNQIEHRGMSPN